MSYQPDTWPGILSFCEGEGQPTEETERRVAALVKACQDWYDDSGVGLPGHDPHYALKILYGENVTP